MYGEAITIEEIKKIFKSFPPLPKKRVLLVTEKGFELFADYLKKEGTPSSGNSKGELMVIHVPAMDGGKVNFYLPPELETPLEEVKYEVKY